MLERLIEQAGRLRRLYANRRTHLIFRLLRGMSALGILAASAWFIWRQFSTGYAAISTAEITLDPHRLIISGLCTAAATALGAWEWALLVNALDGHLDLIRGVRIHLFSNLIKYVPGFIWSYVGKAYLATRQGVPASVAALSIVCEFIIVFFDGALLLALCLPYSGIVSWSAGLRLAFQVGAILLVGLSIATVPLAGRWLVKRLERTNLGPGALRQVDWNQFAFVMAAVLLTWFLLGLGFSILSAPPSSHTWQDTLRQIFALTCALLAGQVAVFVPMGIGVREAIFVALLRPGRSATFALIIALVFRIQMMIGEVFCASIAWLVDKTRVISRNNPKG